MRSRLHVITSMPTENMINTVTFFFRERFNFQRTGIGIIKMIKSCRMLIPAATYATATVLIHLTGGFLYIQFVQLP